MWFTYVDIEGYSKTPNHGCSPSVEMTARGLSDAVKECSDTNCHMFYYGGGVSWNACQETASIFEYTNFILYTPHGNKLYTWF